MTKKHFIEFAKAISEIEDRDARKRVANVIAVVAAKMNPRFDAQKFFAACGVQQ